MVGGQKQFPARTTLTGILLNALSLIYQQLGLGKQHPVKAFVAASRPKTIGKVTIDVEYPTKSNLFFSGISGTMGEHRFEEIPVEAGNKMESNVF